MSSISVENLEHALSLNLIEPAFQPLIHLEQETCIGFEVLARWTDAAHGAVSPLEFIPMAEASGLIGVLTHQIISKACTQAAGFAGDPILAFNLSPLQFRSANLFDEVCQSVVATGFPLDHVHIEMTESALLEDESIALETISKFQAAGMGVALDDFGTGYASLTRLHSFPFNKLKIDASFVKSMETDIGSRKIVASVIGLAQSLGMAVVAEGVETSKQVALLKALGCDIGQGYFFGKPTLTTAAVLLLPFPAGPMPEPQSRASPFQKIYQLEALYEGAPIALAFIDAGGRFLTANERFAHVFGSTRDGLAGRVIQNMFSARQGQAISRIIDAVMRGKSLREKELTDCATGQTYIVACNRVVDAAGSILGISISLVNMTRRKTAESALRADEEHFRRAVEFSPHLAWAAKPNGEVYYMSPALSGSTSTSVGDRIADWYARMNPDDRLRVRAEWLAWIPSNRRFSTEFRIRWSDGLWRWVRSEADPAFADGGKLNRWFGVIYDITEERTVRDSLGRATCLA